MLEKRGKTTGSNDIKGLENGLERNRTSEKSQRFRLSENDPKLNPKLSLHEAPQVWGTIDPLTVELYLVTLTLAWRLNRPLTRVEASLVDRLRASHPQLARRLDRKVSRDLAGKGGAK